MSHLTFDRVHAAGPWRPIPDCPGRLAGRGRRDVTLTDLSRADARVEVFVVETARDPVHVVVFEDVRAHAELARGIGPEAEGAAGYVWPRRVE